MLDLCETIRKKKNDKVSRYDLKKALFSHNPSWDGETRQKWRRGLPYGYLYQGFCVASSYVTWDEVHYMGIQAHPQWRNQIPAKPAWILMALRPMELAFVIGELQVYQGSGLVSWLAFRRLFGLGSLQKNDTKWEIWISILRVWHIMLSQQQTGTINHWMTTWSCLACFIIDVGQYWGYYWSDPISTTLLSVTGSFGIFVGQSQTPKAQLLSCQLRLKTKVPDVYLGVTLSYYQSSLPFFRMVFSLWKKSPLWNLYQNLWIFFFLSLGKTGIQPMY